MKGSLVRELGSRKGADASKPMGEVKYFTRFCTSFELALTQKVSIKSERLGSNWLNFLLLFLYRFQYIWCFLHLNDWCWLRESLMILEVSAHSLFNINANLLFHCAHQSTKLLKR